MIYKKIDLSLQCYKTLVIMKNSKIFRCIEFVSISRGTGFWTNVINAKIKKYYYVPYRCATMKIVFRKVLELLLLIIFNVLYNYYSLWNADLYDSAWKRLKIHEFDLVHHATTVYHNNKIIYQNIPNWVPRRISAWKSLLSYLYNIIIITSRERGRNFRNDTCDTLAWE